MMENDLFNVIASQMDAEREQKSGVRACIAASARVQRRYGNYLKKAESDQELEARLDLIEDDMREIAEDTSKEHDYDDSESVYQLVSASLLKGSPYPENSEKNAPDHSPEGHHWPKEVNSIYNACMRENPDYGKEKCAKIAWAKSGDKHESALGDNVWQYGNQFDNANQAVDSMRSPLGRVCPNCHQPINGAGACPYCQANSGTPLTAAVKEAEFGDTYQQERVSPTQGAGPVPKIDKSRVPEDGLEAIDVPSKDHPLEHQDLLQPRDYDKSFDPSDVTKHPHKMVDADEAIGNTEKIRTKTYPSGKHADPVTSKWHVSDAS